MKQSVRRSKRLQQSDAAHLNWSKSKATTFQTQGLWTFFVGILVILIALQKWTAYRSTSQIDLQVPDDHGAIVGSQSPDHPLPVAPVN